MGEVDLFVDLLVHLHTAIYYGTSCQLQADELSHSKRYGTYERNVSPFLYLILVSIYQSST